MKSQILAGLVALALAAGCSTTPDADSPLARARSDYNAAQADPRVTSLAPLELKQANDSLDRANNASSKGEKRAVVDHLAYVTTQHVAIARETARQKSAELAIASAGAERDRVRLEARTREADQAQRAAEQARRQAEASQRDAQSALSSAERAQRQAAAERQSALDAQMAARAAQQQAAAERQSAQDAQQSANAARLQGQEAEARARQLEEQLKALEAKKTDRGMVVTLGDVLFDTNRAQLKSGGMRNVQRLADFFKQYPQRTVLIEGFTDSTGTSARNQELSEERAQSVRIALLDMGVASERIKSRGYGSAYPTAGNDTAEGRQMNRRVEIIVSDDGGAIPPR